MPQLPRPQPQLHFSRFLNRILALGSVTAPVLPEQLPDGSASGAGVFAGACAAKRSTDIPETWTNVSNASRLIASESSEPESA